MAAVGRLRAGIEVTQTVITSPGAAAAVRARPSLAQAGPAANYGPPAPYGDLLVVIRVGHGATENGP